MKILKHWRRSRNGAFTLVEVIVSVAIFALVSVGLIYGYVQSNRMAQFEAASLAVQSFASEGAEQARDANWRPRDTPITNGPGTMDELPPSTNTIGGTNLILDIPSGGMPNRSFLCDQHHHDHDCQQQQPAVAPNPVGCHLAVWADGGEIIHQHRHTVAGT